MLLTHDALLEVFPHNLGYFMFGRHTGFAIYFFPAWWRCCCFCRDTRSRDVAVAHVCGRCGSGDRALAYMPFTYSGGGGPVGNRYFPGSYGLFLFLVPPLQTAIAGLVAMAM